MPGRSLGSLAQRGFRRDVDSISVSEEDFLLVRTLAYRYQESMRVTTSEEIMQTTTIGRRIHVTEADMATLRELVRTSRGLASRDQAHLAELDRELDDADVIAATDIEPNVVTMQSTVRVRDLDSGASTVYTLVFPRDADVERRRISILAPIGTALIGYRVGDRIQFTTPGGTRHLEIADVLYQPEREAA
jgi:regulator of nucleoside diphosphate kinase